MSLQIALLASASLLALACGGATPSTETTQGTARDALVTGRPQRESDDDAPAFEPPPSTPPGPGSDSGASAPRLDGGAGPSLPVATYESCAGKSVGEECSLCAPWDADCVESSVVRVCTASGTCE